MEILYSIFIGIIFGMIVGMIVGIGLQCRRDIVYFSPSMAPTSTYVLPRLLLEFQPNHSIKVASSPN